MHAGKRVFAQLMEHRPLHTFRQCVAKYPTRYTTLKFSHLDQFLCMAFAQLTYRESLICHWKRLRVANVNALRISLVVPRPSAMGRVL